jgi:hypothetical protein
MRTACLACALALATGVSAQLSGTNWPELRPTTKRFRVDLTAEKIAIDLPVLDRTGHEQYHFACRGGRDSYLDSLNPTQNWVGPLMCTLAEGTEARDDSLLSEDDSAAWFSRAHFRRSELVGSCASYPEFGTHRSFRLRGFRLRLDADHIAVDATGDATSFVLNVSVRPDRSARSSQAERPGFLDPRGLGQTCDVVRRGAEPRRCRDPQGSWTLCGV